LKSIENEPDTFNAVPLKGMKSNLLINENLAPIIERLTLLNVKPYQQCKILLSLYQEFEIKEFQNIDSKYLLNRIRSNWNRIVDSYLYDIRDLLQLKSKPDPL
jgi:hypothetical protein